MNATKQAVIDNALRLFRERGYDSVSVNDICTESGVTKTTFYYHLQSKDEIVALFYNSVTATLAERLVDVLEEDDPWEQFIAVFFALIDESARIGPDLLGQLMILNLRSDRGTFDFDENLTKMAVLLIEKAQRQGQIRNRSEALPLYRAAAHAFEGFELMWCVKNGMFDRKAVLRAAFEQIFDAADSVRTSAGDISY